MLMIPPTPHKNSTLVLRRVFTATQLRVFRAWIEPEALETDKGTPGLPRFV